MSQMGVRSSIRRKRDVRAGRTVDDVAVLCVDRKSVRRMNGSRRMLQREVNTLRVSTISSRVLWFRDFISESLLFRATACSFIQPVVESGENLLTYMRETSATTASKCPAHLIRTSPYSVAAQKPASTRKLSQASPVVHDISPTSLFSTRRKGWEYASALVIWGGVARRSGDF